MTRGSLFTAVMLLAAVAAAQQRAVQETIEVSLVNVDVIVTDKQGQRVTGLTAADFEIREAGKLQPITNFAEYGPTVTGGTASVEGVPAAEAVAIPRPPRTIVVFVETTRVAPFHAKQMFDAIRQLLRSSVASEDRVTIVEWRRGVVVRQEFTGDLTKIETVLAAMENEHAHGPRDLSDDVRRDQAESDADAAAMEARGLQVHTMDAALRQRAEIRQKARALEAVMNSISGVDGRKIMIMAMRRFGLHAGAEFFSGSSIPFDRRSELSTEELRDSLIRTANANNVALYPIYATGLQWAGVPGAEFDLAFGALEGNKLLNETTALQDIAEATGGLMAWGAGNIAEMLPRVADDLETYYSLAYRVPASGKDVTRRIEVRTKNPRYDVRSRRHFVEKSDETQMKDRLVANLYQSIEASAIPFEVILGKLETSGRKRWELPIRIRIPVKALATLQAGRHEAGEFSIHVVTGGVLGVTSEVLRRAQPFRIPRGDLARARESHFTYDFTIRIDEKVDRLSVAVFDETAKEVGMQRIRIPARATATGK